MTKFSKRVNELNNVDDLRNPVPEFTGKEGYDQLNTREDMAWRRHGRLALARQLRQHLGEDVYERELKDALLTAETAKDQRRDNSMWIDP